MIEIKCNFKKQNKQKKINFDFIFKTEIIFPIIQTALNIIEILIKLFG